MARVTITDVLAEMRARHDELGKKTLDLRRLAALLEEVPIDAVCPETGLTPLL